MLDRAEKRKAGRALGSKMAKDLSDYQERLEKLSNVEDQLDRLHKIEGVLKKHKIFGWRWYRNIDDAIKDLDDTLSSSYPMELVDVEDTLQSALNMLKKIKERRRVNYADTSHKTQMV